MTLTIDYTKNPAAPAGQTYTLTLINQSAQNWRFYAYQQLPGQTRDVYSLAWFCSPHDIKDGDRISFQWQTDLCFTCAVSGQLMPGLSYIASGTQYCDPAGANETDFSVGASPHLSTPAKTGPSGSLLINDAVSVPPSQFSVGIGMSGTTTHAVQAGPNLSHSFTPTPSYWVAAGTNVQLGEVLNVSTILMNSEARFGPGLYDLTCTLDQSMQWTIT